MVVFVRKFPRIVRYENERVDQRAYNIIDASHGHEIIYYLMESKVPFWGWESSVAAIMTDEKKAPQLCSLKEPIQR